MDRPDATAQAALEADIRFPVDIAFLDIAGDVLRVTNAPYNLTFAGTGDVDLDGFTFSAVDDRFVSVSDIKLSEKGTDTVTLTLSGLPGLDDDMMTQIGNKTNWQGRDCRVWKAMLNPADLTRVGSVWSHYTGVMSVPKVVGDRESQTIKLDVESYTAFFSQPSNRSYLDQQSYDPGDHSAEMAIAIANGAGNRS